MRSPLVVVVAVASLSLCTLATGHSVLGARRPPTVVKKLTDATFEHDTQAASGATTGDWLVMLYTGWCPHCRDLAGVWENIGHKLHGRVNVAKVDTSTNPETSRRFGVKSVPTIILLHQGDFYLYSGPREIDELVAFAVEGYQQSGTRSKVPAEQTFFEYLVEILTVAIFEDSDAQQAAVIAFFSVFCTGVIVFTCCARGSVSGGRLGGTRGPGADDGGSLMAERARAEQLEREKEREEEEQEEEEDERVVVLKEKTVSPVKQRKRSSVRVE